MTTIRSFTPEIINEPLWYVIGRLKNSYKYYLKSTSNTFNANEVYPGIYVGDIESSLNINELKKRRIGNILSILNGAISNYPDDFNYKIIHLNDDKWANIERYFEESSDFIDLCLEKNGKVLVHCSRGVSRSATLVLAYLIARKKMTLNDALELLQAKRSIIDPNCGFLSKLEKISVRSYNVISQEDQC